MRKILSSNEFEVVVGKPPNQNKITSLVNCSFFQNNISLTCGVLSNSINSFLPTPTKFEELEFTQYVATLIDQLDLKRGAPIGFVELQTLIEFCTQNQREDIATSLQELIDNQKNEPLLEDLQILMPWSRTQLRQILALIDSKQPSPSLYRIE